MKYLKLIIFKIYNYWYKKQDYWRASGDCICNWCGRNYYSHPMHMKKLDWNGDPYLHVLCNGDKVKL